MSFAKLPAWMTTPVGIVSIIGALVFAIEYVILRAARDLLRPSFPFDISHRTWELVDALILTLLVAPLSYVLVRKMRERDLRVKKAVLDSENRYRSVVEQSIVGVTMIQHGRCTYANQAMTNMLGLHRPEDLVGQEAISMVADRDRPKLTKIMRQRNHANSGRVQFTCALIRANGTMVEAEVNTVVTSQDGVPTMIAVLRDITERLRAEEAANRHVMELEAAFMSAVQLATDLTELRDPYTHGHARRVGEISAAIGAELGLDTRMQQGLQVAGNLHDIGKIGIPLNILCTQEKLTDQEWELIRRHPQTGYDILKSINLPWPIAETAQQHHERMDGSGYPQRLSGEDIILEARIVMVADVVESMSHSRPYRPGMGIAKALAEIEQGSGTRFDSAVVTACLRLFRENGYAIPP